MQTFEKRSRIEVPVDRLFDWHRRPGAFERLMPPWEKLELVRRVGGIENGARTVLRLRKGPLRLRWEAVHRDFVEGRQFVDEQVRGPFARWVHTHRFEADGDQASILDDRVEYQLKFGAPGALLAGGMIAKQLERMFQFRHRRTRDDLVRQRLFADRARQHIVISGASGLVGQSLAPFLTTAGHRVSTLVRQTPRNRDEIRWNPGAGQIDMAALEGVDCVVHLAGENVAGGSWTPRRKAAIRNSRVEGTRLLSQTLARLAVPPKTLISASAIGYYGDRGDEVMTEHSNAGTGFLADICREWESETRHAVDMGIRVVNVRIGIVLSPGGGALGKLLTPFSLGAGGVVGAGTQYMSWIALDDLIGLIHFAMFTESLRGPLNATAPAPVTNADFTRELGQVLHRPTVLPLPEFAVRALFGEMGQTLLLGGVRVEPRAALNAGFEFLHPTLEGALRAEMGL